jgi:hypothetical protein
MRIISSSSGFVRVDKSGSLQVGGAENSESDFVLPRQKINHGGQARQKIAHVGQARQTAIPPKRWRSRKIGGQEDSAFWFDFRLRSLTFGGQARQKVNHGGQAAHHRRMLRQSRSDAFGKRRRMEKNRKIMVARL